MDETTVLLRRYCGTGTTVSPHKVPAPLYHDAKVPRYDPAVSNTASCWVSVVLCTNYSYRAEIKSFLIITATTNVNLLYFQSEYELKVPVFLCILHVYVSLIIFNSIGSPMRRKHCKGSNFTCTHNFSICDTQSKVSLGNSIITQEGSIITFSLFSTHLR